ncbi:MAG: choice-of-anchor D domain-containing protein [Deltaproteobacteria bacterium]|nr:choice-of-anchor D domain-containing protein [Deltaproteobacteria bacterium]
MKRNYLKTKRCFLFLVVVSAFCMPAAAFAGNATYSYDVYDRVERAAYDNGPVVEYSYDTAGNLAGKTVISNVLHVSTASGGGTVSSSGGADCGRGCYFFNTPTMVTLTALPDVGRQVTGWSEAACGTNLTCAVNVDSMKHVTVTFTTETFTLNPISATNGNIDPDTAQTVNYGSSMAFTMMPDEGYILGDVLINGAPAGAINPYTFTNVTAACNIQPSFVADPVTLSAETLDFGTLECGTTSATQTVTVSNTGSVDRVIGTVGLTSGAAAEYALVSDTCSNITLAPWASCNVDIQFSPAYKWSARVTMLTFPYTDDYIADKSIELTGNGGDTCAGDMSVILPVLYAVLSVGNITVNAGEGGAIIQAGGDTYNIVPHADYEILDVIVDGSPEGPLSSYTFTDLYEDHTLQATFYSLMVSSKGSVNRIEGTNTLEILPDSGYVVKDVLIDGISLGPVTTYTFEDTSSSYTVEVLFEVDAAWIMTIFKIILE